MKRVARYPIRARSELIYTKVAIANRFKGHPWESLYPLAAMELGSNILKHGNAAGELWLVHDQEAYWLVALDRGPGIADVALALKSGYSTYHEPSLGIGLSSLAQTDGFTLQIATYCDKALHGTVVVFGPKRPWPPFLALSIPFAAEGNGDFVVAKGSVVLIGDAAGHGRRAEATAVFVAEQFQTTFRSFLLADEWLRAVHTQLQLKELRPVELLLAAIDHTQLLFVGAGNLTLWHHANGSYHSLALRPGSFGEVLGKLTHGKLPLQIHPVAVTTDGILSGQVAQVLAHLHRDNPLAILCSLLFFCGSLSDDATAVIFFGAKHDN